MLDVLYQIKEVTGRHMMPFIIMILTIHLINLWGEGVGGRGHDNFNILTGIFFEFSISCISQQKLSVFFAILAVF